MWMSIITICSLRPRRPPQSNIREVLSNKKNCIFLCILQWFLLAFVKSLRFLAVYEWAFRAL